MAVDLRKVKKLIELVEESAIHELEVSSGDESVRIVMHGGGQGVAVTPGPSQSVTSALQQAPLSAAQQLSSVPAPMAGTFYRAPHPDAEAFVQVGQRVAIGDVLCIIESMKMMHEIRAAADGTVAQICIDNGTPINTGDTLFKLS